jgi:hypothetical protein
MAVDYYLHRPLPDKSLNASGISRLVIDNFSLTWLYTAASTLTLGAYLVTV